MKKQISYYDPRCPELPVTDGCNMTVIATGEDEYNAHMAALGNPERGITNIAEEDLPDDETPDAMEFLHGLIDGLTEA